MKKQTLINRLNSLTKYSLEETGNGWQSDKNMEEDQTSGEWVKCEDIAALFDLAYGYVLGEGDRFQEKGTEDKPESPKIKVTAGFLLDSGKWDDWCEMSGTSEWAVKEGLMDRNEEIELTLEQAQELNLV